MAALTAGTLLLDVAMQCGMVADQARIFVLRPDARSRLNTAYMTCAYLGGSAGSWLGTRAYGHAGRPGVCALVAALTALALTHHLFAAYRRRPRASRTPTDQRTSFLSRPSTCTGRGPRDRTSYLT
ncbi:MAG: hypothetical protein ACJ72W_20920 [Actinoallomurus sp.]